MGADVVIAVHLEIAPVNTSKLQNLFSVLGLSVEVVIHQNELGGLPAADLVVNVHLKAFDAIGYKNAGPIIDRGSQAAAGKANILAPYTLDDAAWNRSEEHTSE